MVIFYCKIFLNVSRSSINVTNFYAKKYNCNGIRNYIYITVNDMLCNRTVFY